MRSICFAAPTAAIVASCVAVLTGTAAHAQSVSATLLGVYKQASSNACTNSPTCRVDFSTVQQNLKVLRVSCTVDVQSNVTSSVIGDFELGNATSDQTGYSFGQFLAPLARLTGTSGQRFRARAAPARKPRSPLQGRCSVRSRSEPYETTRASRTAGCAPDRASPSRRTRFARERVSPVWSRSDFSSAGPRRRHHASGQRHDPGSSPGGRPRPVGTSSE